MCAVCVQLAHNMETIIFCVVVFLADTFSNFSTVYGHSDAFSLSNVLWTCSDMLAKRYVVVVNVLDIIILVAVFSVLPRKGIDQSMLVVSLTI